MNKIDRVCIVDSVRSLFLYFLISSENEIENTFYFFSDGISDIIRRNLPNHFHIKKRKQIARLFSLFFIRITSRMRWKFLKTAKIYGHDHLPISPVLIGNRSFTVIEDGLVNYVPHTSEKGFFYQIKRTALNRFPIKYGYSSQCTEVVLTGLQEMDFSIKNKINYISIIDLWNQSPNLKKEKIKHLFNISVSDVKDISSRKQILFTQPFSEPLQDQGGIISEAEKILLYSSILENYNHSDVVLKTHPLEKTDYRIYFPEVCVFDKVIPMELFNCLNIKFDKAITLYTTAVFSFPYEIEIDWYGTEVDEKIFDTIGHIDISDNLKKEKRINIIKLDVSLE